MKEGWRKLGELDGQIPDSDHWLAQTIAQDGTPGQTSGKRGGGPAVQCACC